MDFSPLPAYNKGFMTKLAPHIKAIIFGALLLVLGGVVGYKVARLGGVSAVAAEPKILYNLTNVGQPTEKKNVDFSQFWEVWNILEQHYLDPDKLKQDQMVYGAIKGMTASLGDPYTLY